MTTEREDRTPSQDLARCLVNAMLTSQHVSQRADMLDVAENYLTIAFERWQDELVERMNTTEDTND